MRTVLCLIAASSLLVTHAHSDDLTLEERQVWELEEAYYQFAQDNDPEGYLALFSDEAIGWPALDSHPKGKDKFSQWISIVHANPAEVWRYELERRAIQSFGDVVVVHYRLRDYFVSAESGEELRSENYRISHTWLRRDGHWQIISGMGGTYHRTPASLDSAVEAHARKPEEMVPIG